MAKKVIKLNETALRKLIRESITKVLKEQEEFQRSGSAVLDINDVIPETWDEEKANKFVEYYSNAFNSTDIDVLGSFDFYNDETFGNGYDITSNEVNVAPYVYKTIDNCPFIDDNDKNELKQSIDNAVNGIDNEDYSFDEVDDDYDEEY